MVNSVGMLGAGPVGQAIARRCVAVGITVLLSNSRGPDSLSGVVGELGRKAEAATVRQAATTDLVVLAVPFVKVPDVVAEIVDWNGRVAVGIPICLGALFRSESAGTAQGSPPIGANRPRSEPVRVDMRVR